MAPSNASDNRWDAASGDRRTESVLVHEFRSTSLLSATALTYTALCKVCDKEVSQYREAGRVWERRTGGQARLCAPLLSHSRPNRSTATEGPSGSGEKLLPVAAPHSAARIFCDSACPCGTFPHPEASVGAELSAERSRVSATCESARSG